MAFHIIVFQKDRSNYFSRLYGFRNRGHNVQTHYRFLVFYSSRVHTLCIWKCLFTGEGGLNSLTSNQSQDQLWVSDDGANSMYVKFNYL